MRYTDFVKTGQISPQQVHHNDCSTLCSMFLCCLLPECTAIDNKVRKIVYNSFSTCTQITGMLPDTSNAFHSAHQVGQGFGNEKTLQHAWCDYSHIVCITEMYVTKLCRPTEQLEEGEEKGFPGFWERRKDNSQIKPKLLPQMTWICFLHAHSPVTYRQVLKYNICVLTRSAVIQPSEKQTAGEAGWWKGPWQAPTQGYRTVQQKLAAWLPWMQEVTASRAGVTAKPHPHYCSGAVRQTAPHVPDITNMGLYQGCRGVMGLFSVLCKFALVESINDHTKVSWSFDIKCGESNLCKHSTNIFYIFLSDLLLMKRSVAVQWMSFYNLEY